MKLFLSLLVVLMLCGSAFAEDWPRWRGANFDAIVREDGLAQKWPDEFKPLWTAQVGPGFSAPVAKDGRLYIFAGLQNKETLFCFDATTGQEIWRQPGGSVFAARSPGPRAAPTIDGDRIYTFGGLGDLTARDLKTGEFLWQLNVIKSTDAQNIRWGAASAPLVAGDLVIVQGGVGNVPLAVAVNTKTGKIHWTSQAKGQSTYAAPILIEIDGNKQLIVLAADLLVAMDPQTGKTIWSHPWKTSHDIKAAMPIYRDGLLFLTAGYGHGSLMLKVSPTGVQESWNSRAIMGRFVTPILDNGALYGTDESGTLCCLDWATGAVKWEAADRGLRLGMGGSYIRAGDNLIALTDTGTLLLIQATPESCRKISETKLFTGKEIWTSPVVHNGKLYVKGESQLLCLDISEKTQK